ncbi:MAG: hypothetical protein IPL20_03185 [Saprospiraceae bacterium]|nr:hypothetical protein [Saprospiraceae bacterium]
MERVLNMTEYMNSVYEEYLLPIQSAIIKGQKRFEMAKSYKPLQMRPF